jgi:hypothetical protein
MIAIPIAVFVLFYIGVPICTRLFVLEIDKFLNLLRASDEKGKAEAARPLLRTLDDSSSRSNSPNANESAYFLIVYSIAILLVHCAAASCLILRMYRTQSIARMYMVIMNWQFNVRVLLWKDMDTTMVLFNAVVLARFPTGYMTPT